MKNILRPQTLALGLIAVFGLAGIGLAVPPVTADHGGCFSNHAIGHHNSWAVTDLHRDFYRAGTTGFAILVPFNGDADLYTWTDGCGAQLFSSRNGGTANDVVPVLAGQLVEVRYFSGGVACPIGWNGNSCIDYIVHLHSTPV